MSGLSLMSVGSMVNTKEATAEAGDVLNGKTFFAGDYHIKTGTMPNKGAWNDSVAMNGSVTIPAGYHNGSGKVRGPNITDNGAWNDSVAMNGSVTIPAGYHNGSGKVRGPNITDNGAWGATINPGSSVTIPAGYHNGSGRITANSCKVRVLEATASDSGYHGPNHSGSASVNIGGLGTIVGVYAGIGGSSIYDQNMSGGKHNSSISISGVSISGSTAYATVTWWRSFYGGEYWQCSATVKFFVLYY